MIIVTGKKRKEMGRWGLTKGLKGGGGRGRWDTAESVSSKLVFSKENVPTRIIA